MSKNTGNVRNMGKAMSSSSTHKGLNLSGRGHGRVGRLGNIENPNRAQRRALKSKRKET